MEDETCVQSYHLSLGSGDLTSGPCGLAGAHVEGTDIDVPTHALQGFCEILYSKH